MSCYVNQIDCVVDFVIHSESFHSIMSSPPWLKSLQRALASNTSLAFSKYMQLATVTPQGMPANRTVVFRGLAAPELQHAAIMVSDSRSEKFTHFSHQPHAEIAWYFPLTREQFRIFGRVVVIDNSVEEQSNDQSAAAEQAGGWQTLFATREEAAAYRLCAWAAQSDTARLTYDQAHPGHARGTVSRSDLDKVLSILCMFWG
jgi:hypothetical protein